MSSGLVATSFMVIANPNPGYSVFWLVLAFVNAAMLVISFGMGYIGLIIILVYVGAIAVLFLFVVMLIQQPNKVDFQDHSHFLPVGLSVMFLFYGPLVSGPKYINDPVTWSENNIEAIGRHLYTTYYELIVISSLILLIALIGTILLAKQPNPSSLRNSFYKSTQQKECSSTD